MNEGKNMIWKNATVGGPCLRESREMVLEEGEYNGGFQNQKNHTKKNRFFSEKISPKIRKRSPYEGGGFQNQEKKIIKFPTIFDFGTGMRFEFLVFSLRVSANTHPISRTLNQEKI